MIYPQLYAKSGKRRVTAGLIGSGHYSTALMGQAMSIPMLDISVVAEIDAEAAAKAFRHAGIPEDMIARCDSRIAALQALRAGKYVHLEDPMLMMDLPLDVIVEGTGKAEEGALLGEEIIRHGKHLAMLNKEADAIVGPYLKHLADRAGVVYTQVDGDQHGLLINFVQWARSLGLEIVSAGKSPDAEVALDRENMRVTIAKESLFLREDRWTPIDKEQLRVLTHMPESVEDKRRVLAARREIFKDLIVVRAQEVCETMIAANALGLQIDAERMHLPVLRATDLPCVLCPGENGGILHGKGRVDMISHLRDVDDANLGGGVFAVVTSPNAYARDILNNKGLHHSPDGGASLITRPYHLCGVETATSVLCAGMLGISTLAGDYLPAYDMYSRTRRPMKAGETIDSDDDLHMEAFIAPAVAAKPGNPLSSYAYHGRKLTRDIPAGTVITLDMTDIPADSALISLRRRQDEYFGI